MSCSECPFSYGGSSWVSESAISIVFEDWFHVWKELYFLNGLDSGYHFLKCCMH